MAPPTELRSPRFLAFLLAQFLGAANDNAFKVTIVLLILATVPDETTQVLYSSLATAFFPIPFLLFSPLAGWLADRFAKHRVLLWTKLPEVVAMALATLGFALGSLSLLMLALFVMATQSAFFSPAKYGILPEVFANDSLSMANGILELATNLAILLGSVAGVWIYSLTKANLVEAGVVYFVVAGLGTIAILFAPRAPEGNPDARFAWNALACARSDWAEVRKNRVLFYTLLGIAYFGFIGSVFLTLIPIFGKNVLGLPEENAGILLAVLSIGIAAGSVVAGKLSKGHVEIGLVPLGSIGITLFAIDLALYGAGEWRLPLGIPARAAADLVLLGLASGFFIVPLNALLQQRSPEGMKGRLIAFSNVLTFSAVLVAAAVPWILSTVFGFGTANVILAVAITTIAGTLYVMNLLPDFLVRLVLWLVTNTIYRIRPIGERNIPKEGALFVANHVSWVDWMLVGGACDRMIRFLMYRVYYEWPVLNWFFRKMGVIPVAAGDPPAKTEESLRIAAGEIAAGHVVAIFAEGAITRTGNLLKFKRGFEKIASAANAPVVPVYLEGVWGSIFSFEGGRFFLKRPRRLFAPVNVLFGEPMPPTAKAHEVRARIQELSVEAFEIRKSGQRPLHVNLVRAARRSWRRTLMVGADGSRLSFGEALERAMALADALFHRRSGDERVGILLPPGLDAAIANFAVSIGGRIAVNLDVSGDGSLARTMIERAGVSIVLSKREVVERLALVTGFLRAVPAEEIRDGEPRFLAAPHAPEVGDGPPFFDVDDALRAAPPAPRFRSLACRFLPASLVASIWFPGGGIAVDRPAAIFFSYPADEPERPNAALLTHHNLLSNFESLRQVLRVDGDDVILGLLPFSNAIGFAATLWLPAIAGARVVYAADLLGEAALGTLAAAEGATLLPANPPLLEKLVATVEPEDLRTLRFVGTGGEDLSEDLAERFERTFGIEPLEGYGRPECAPIVSLNLPESGKHRQPGARPGSTGQPLPGVSVRIVDPATSRPLPPGEDGILWIRGPNVMQGYVDDPKRTAEALVDGWYVTGDRARLDDDGFLTVYY